MKIRLNKRNTNFSPTDIKLLLSLVAERKSIINCKKTDRMNTQIKEDSWQAIQKAFNAKSTVLRTSRELKKKYENIKSMAKKQSMVEKIHHYTPESAPQDIYTMQETTQDKNHCQNSNYDNVDKDSKDVNISSDNEDGRDSISDHIHETTTSWTKFANIKNKLIEDRAQAEINMLREEHHIKMRHLEERHRMEMEKIAIELEILKANLALKRKELDIKNLPINEKF